MARETFYTAVDIGSSKVVTVVARVGSEGELKVLGTGIAPSQGMQKGCIDNMTEVREAVRCSVEEAQRYVGKGYNPSAYVVVSGGHIRSTNLKDVMDHPTDLGSITSGDMHRFIQSSFPTLGEGQEILHIIPIGYSVDGLSGVRNPIGLHATKVELEAHIAVGDATILKNTVNAVEANRLPVNSLVLQSLASAESTLTADEREMGVLFIDIGSGTTDVTVFQYGSPWFSTVLPVGGSQLTRDLAVAERIPFHVAEEAKIKRGNIMPELVDPDEEVLLSGGQGQPQKLVKRRHLCEPLNARMYEILQMVVQRMSQAGINRLPDGGVVFTGGTAEIAGLQEFTESVLGEPVRVAYPTGVTGLPTQLRKPGFSAAVGTLLWGIKHQGEGRTYRAPEDSTRGYRSLFNIFKRNKEKDTPKVAAERE
ncbi:MAG: cell division protein FtsA [Chloroflexota bacterium]|nr:cell division protein FtsA [Chloroflexota bacterium]